jgi:hypothetical protein
MVTAREAFEAKKLASKYGIPGKVAARYRMAGYTIEMLSADPDADAHFKAIKRREALLVRVYWSSTRVSEDVLKRLAEAAKEGSKAVLVLYGAGPRITEDFLSKAKELGITVKRVRP